MRMRQSAICMLREGFSQLSTDGSLQECLAALSELTAAIVDAQDCRIVLFGEDDVAASALCGEAHFGPPPVPLVPDSGQERSVRKEHMVSAIVLQGKTVGAIHVRGPLRQRVFGSDDLNALAILAPLVARSIQAFQLQKLLDSRFTQIALSKTDAARLGRMTAGAIDHPDRIARILARSFYREMLAAGFDFNQILFAATEVISELAASLRKHGIRRKERAQRNVASFALPGPESKAEAALLRDLRAGSKADPLVVRENAD